MAARNTADNKRFVNRAPNNEIEPYYIPITRSGPIISEPKTVPSVHASSMVIPSTDATISRIENETPVRRVVLVRNSKHPQVNQGSVDLGDLGKSNSLNNSPRLTDGSKSIFLIRRPIASVEHQSSFQDPPLTTSLEYIHTPSPPPSGVSQEFVASSDRPRSPNRLIKSSKRPEHSSRNVPYIPRPRSKTRTASPDHTNSARQSPSPDRIHSKPPRRRSPSLSSSPQYTPKQEEPQKIDEKRSAFSYYSIKNISEPVSSSLPAIDEDEQQIVEHRPKSRKRSGRRMKSAKSVKSVSLVAPDDQSITTIENSSVKEEPLKPIIKRSKSFKKTRFEDEINDDSTDALVKANRWATCLNCLSRYMCLVLIICFLLILIGLAGVGISAYFLAINSSNNLVSTVVGIAVGGFLAITALCFLCILLTSIGSRDDYFTYNGDGPRIGGRAFAMIPPTHPNAHFYIPRDYIKMIENGYPVARISTAKGSRRKSSSILHRSATLSNGHDMKSKKNIMIEMPEGLLTGGSKSAKERELNLNKMVKNIGQIVEDTRKRYHGDLPDKVIVKVDQNVTQTT